MRIAFIGAQSSHDHDRRPGGCRRPRLRRARRGPRRGVRGDRAAHPGAAGAWPLRRDEVHDGAAGDVLSSGVAVAGRAVGGHRRTVLLAAGSPARAGPRPARALHLGRRLRGASDAARGPRPAARRHVSRPRRREPACRPGGGGAGRHRLLRQEHDADHPAARVVGRARHARHRPRARSDPGSSRRLRQLHDLHRCVPDGGARRARDARRDEVPVVLDAGSAGDPRELSLRARCTGLRVRHLPGRLPLEPRRREAAGRRRAFDGRSRRPRRLARGGRQSGRRRLRAALRPSERPALAATERTRRSGQHGNAGARPAASALCERRRPTARRARFVVARAGRGADVTRRPHSLEWWIAVVRLCAVPFAVLQVSITSGLSGTNERIAWTLVVVLAIGAVALFATVGDGTSRVHRALSMAFDFSILGAFVVLYAFEQGTPTRQLLLIGVVAGAIRYGMVGGIVTALAYVPVSIWFEERRADLFDASFHTDYVTFQAGAGLIMASLVGWLVSRIHVERENVERRAEEAEELRDELGRRADLLDAANRCARALNSSLDLDEASTEFIRELRGLVPFDRMAIVLAEDGVARVIATAGERADEVMPPGTVIGLERNLLAEVVSRGQTVVREDMAADPRYAEEAKLIELGVRTRVAAPLLAGARTIGLISVGRSEPRSFTDHEVELVGLLGRLAASAVQNIRAYESERRTVEELRRLSALRADFVSLVSHELRSPMAAVIGAARTLQARWRELQPEQRDAFLALIGDETTRLAALVGDVLDSSRIDAGTFSYRFGDVDVAGLVHESVAAAAVAQGEVPITADVPPIVPLVRGDAQRLRQVLGNLIENAVKYSPAGSPVQIRVSGVNGNVTVAVRDEGLGIASEDQRLIFEKFGRVSSGNTKPGTGLGLYIARSIAEAHGGSLAVASAQGRGATFTLTLPAG